MIKNTVIFREWSLHETLSDNMLRLQFPGLSSLLACDKYNALTLLWDF